MTSVWIDHADPVPADPLDDRSEVDDVIVGAGLTGLTTAVLLARAGRRVAVVEARRVGAVTTGHTTGKVSLLQGTKLSQMLGLQSHRVAQAYVDANVDGQEWLLAFCHDHGVPVDRRDAVTYAAREAEVRSARDELEAARALGLGARWVDSLDVPFPAHGGVVLSDQAQLDPMTVLRALVLELRRHGGTVHEGRRVVSVAKTGKPTATLDDGSRLSGHRLVLATGTPLLDRGLYFAKVEAHRSYLLAFEGTEPPRDMYLSAGSPIRSLREVTRPDGSSLLLVGGEGHVVGRATSELEHLERLRTWVAHHFPGARETHAWSAQDYRSHDGIPYVGALPRGGGRILLATGFDKWGLTNGVAAAKNIAGHILGEKPQWAGVLGRRITRPTGAANIVRTNAAVGIAAVRHLADLGLHAVPSSPPPEGAGVVGRDGLVPTGVSTVDGRTCSITAICTHLGGALSWNDAEKSWDCPLHGSRFGADGAVLEGPATKPLTPRSHEPPGSR